LYRNSKKAKPAGILYENKQGHPAGCSLAADAWPAHIHDTITGTLPM